MSSFELHHRASTYRVLGVTVLAAALSLAACGDDGATTGGSGDSDDSDDTINPGA